MPEILKVSTMGYWRYVDDHGNALTSIDPGVRMVGGGPITSPWMEVLPFFPSSPWLEVKPELIEQDKLRAEDERTAAFLCEVANSIHPSITVKSDFPSKNTDNMMPLLDLKLWVEEMSSKYFIPFRSAHSKSMKRSMLANEGLRRLLNMSPTLEWNESVKVMNEFAVKMSRSGYPASWREEAVKVCIQKYEAMVQEDKDGKRPLFRPKYFMAEDKKLSKLKKSSLWHKSGTEEGAKAGAPLIICPSAGEVISKKMKDVCKIFKNEHNIDVKVFERGGIKIGNIAKSDPLSPSTCGRNDCFSCTSGGGGGDCTKSCSAYSIECEDVLKII